MKKSRCVTWVVLVLLLLSALSSFFTGEAASALHLDERLLHPSILHPFGTDSLGRDLAARCAWALMNSVICGLSVTLSSLVMAVAVAFLGLYMKYLDGPLMRLCDAMKALPSTLLAVLMMVVMGPGLVSITAALSAVFTPQCARAIRGRASAVMKEGYVEASLAMGLGRAHVISHTVLPHCQGVMLTQALFIFSSAILAEAGLSFIGAGLPADVPSLGGILNEARGVMHQAWWMLFFPSMILLVLTWALHSASPAGVGSAWRRKDI